MLLVGSANFTINTIIGGVAASISSKTLLASKLGIKQSEIRRFEIIGSDVHANIRSNYILANGFAFQNDLTITKFIDLEGKCTSTFTSIFQGCTNLIELRMKSLTALVGNFIQSTPNLVEVEFGVLKSIETVAAQNTSAVFPTNMVNSIGNSALVNNKFTLIDLTSMTSIPNSSPITGATLATQVLMPNVVSITSSVQFFQNLTSCNYINLKKLKTYGIHASGGVSAFNLGFQNLKLNCTIEVNIAMATANSGSPHAAFLWVKNNRNAIVKFFDDNGNYVSTL